MRRFTSVPAARRFLVAFRGFCNRFRPRRHLPTAAEYRAVRRSRDRGWRELAGAAVWGRSLGRVAGRHGAGRYPPGVPDDAPARPRRRLYCTRTPHNVASCDGNWAGAPTVRSPERDPFPHVFDRMAMTTRESG